MFFRTFNIKTGLNTESILNALKANSYPTDSAWYTNEFDNKTVSVQTYSFKAKNNTFKLRARKTNQRRKSRPLCFGKIIPKKNNTEINVTVIPHTGSLIAWSIFLLVIVTLLAVAQNISQILSSTLFFIGGACFYHIQLKYNTKDVEIHIKKVLKDYASSSHQS